MLQVLLLGSPQIRIDQQSVSRLRRKNRALLCFLAAHRDPQSRDRLLDLFWPDHERSSAQQILRTMLHDLRQHLGEALVIDGDLLALANAQVDVLDFQEQLARPPTDTVPLHETLALYRDDFLKGFTVPDSPDFDDWAATEREHYRVLAVRGWVALSSLYEGSRNDAAAMESLEEALRFDPLQEDLQRACMRLQYLSGDRPGAILRYDRLYKLLDTELGVTPMAETRALYDVILDDTPVVSESSRSTTSMFQGSDTAFLPFVGRSAELQALETSLVPGKLVVIEGEPGIGKTRFVEVFLKGYTQHTHTLILKSNAFEFEQGLPYQPIIDALRGLLSLPGWGLLKAELQLMPQCLAEMVRLMPELADEFPALPPPVAPVSEAQLWESLKQFLLRLARGRPVLLFVDDLQWADSSTYGFLSYLVRRTGLSPLLLVATIRPTAAYPELTTLLYALRHERHLEQLSLQALSSGDIFKLAQHFSPKESQVLSKWLVEHAEGNPYFVTELVRYAYGSRLLGQDGTLDLDVLGWTPVLPPTIYNLIELRLLRLSDTARQTLELAAAVGYQFAYAMIAQTAAVAESDLLDAVDELKNAGLIHPQDDEDFSFDHSLTMEVVYQAMGAARHRMLHRRVAEALEVLHQSDLESVAGVIASHFARSSTPERAVPYAFLAAQRASGLAAWTEAIAFYTLALDGTSSDAQRQDILIARGEARFHVGDFIHATEDFQIALGLARTSGDLPTLENAYLFLNRSLLPQSRFAEAVALGADLRRAGPPELALCAEFIWAAALSVESAHATEAEQHLHEAMRLLDQPRSFMSRITRTLVTYQFSGVMSSAGALCRGRRFLQRSAAAEPGRGWP